jgi:hypothetical protein
MAVAVAAVAATGAHAGPYSDDLAKCLVESTTTEDRTLLVQWMFAAASLHPAVSSIASVSEEQLDEANKRTADLFMRLLSKSCMEETQKALKHEGENTILTSFRILGEVAGRELFSSPEVGGALSGLDKYLDDEKLKSILEAE